MRPRAIQTVPGLDPNASPFERLKEFARMIIRVPKTEVEEERKQETLTVRRRGSKNATNAKK
jgi:hypothetical protein